MNKMHLLALLGPSTDRNDRFPNALFHTLQLVTSLPFHMYLMPEKGTPFGQSLPI